MNLVHSLPSTSLASLATHSDSIRLFRHIDPYLRQMSDKLYLREMSSCDWQQFLEEETDSSTHRLSKEGNNSKIPIRNMEPVNVPFHSTRILLILLISFYFDVNIEGVPMMAHEMTMDLPYVTKYLLIASYLASYNPSKFDLRYFSKNSMKSMRTRTSKKTRHESTLRVSMPILLEDE